MAKGTEDDDLGLDDDFDMDDLGLDDLDFGGSQAEEPPKNSREAVERSLSDGAKGFTEGFTDNKLETAGEIAKASIPSSLSRESDIVMGMSETIKDEFTKAGSEMRQQANSTFAVMKKYIPQSNDKVNSAVEKISQMLGGDSSSSSGPSAAEIQAESIKSELHAALGEKEDANAREQLIRDQIEATRAKSQMDVLSTTAINTERLRKFDYEITNNYYRKSLELQFKSLFVHKEQLEITKSGFDTFKNQLESIVKNSALPEVVKVRNTERLKDTIKTRSTEMMTDMFYSDANPLTQFKKNLGSKVGEAKDKILAGLQGAESGLSAMDSLEGTGMSTGALVGSMGADFMKTKAGQQIGKALEKNQSSREMITKAKGFFGDTSAGFRGLGSDDTVLGKLGNFMGDLTEDRKQSTYSLGKKDLDDISLFDNRAHDSIVKVIPGLLSKIYGEIKAGRTGSNDPTSNEIVYDNKTEKFVTREQLKSNIKSDIKRKIEKGPGAAIQQIIAILSNPANVRKGKESLTLSPQQLTEVRAAIIEYMMNRGSTSFEGLASGKFLSYIKDDNVKSHFKKVVKNVISASMAVGGDFTVLDNLNNLLKNVKTGIPNLKAEMENLNAMGNSDIGEELGLLTTKVNGVNSVNGVKHLNKDGLGSLLNQNIRSMDVQKVNRDIEENKYQARLKAYVSAMPKSKREMFELLSPEEQKLKVLDNTNPDSTLIEKPQFAKGGYTGDGDKYEEAGDVHKKEYVINSEKLEDIMSSLKDADFTTVKSYLGEIAKDIHTSTKDIDLKKKAGEGYKNMSKAGSDAVAVVKDYIPETKEEALELLESYKDKITNNKLSKKGVKQYKALIKKANKNKWLSEVTDGRKRKKYVNKINNGIDTAKEKVEQVKDSKAGQFVTEKTLIAYNKVIDTIKPTETELSMLEKNWKKKHYLISWNEFMVKHGSVILAKNRAMRTKAKLTKGISDSVNDAKDKLSGKVDDAKEKVESFIDDSVVKLANSLPKDKQAILKKNYEKHLKKTPEDDQLSYSEYVSMYGLKTIKHFMSKESKELAKAAKDKLMYGANSLKDNFEILKDKITKKSEDPYAGIEFISKYDDYSPEEQEGLKTEFFASTEYKDGTFKDFNKWLAFSKQIDPGSLRKRMSGLLKKLNEKFNPIVKIQGKINKVKEEFIEEAMSKLTGTGLKELSEDEEEVLKEKFLSSDAYKNGHVNDFDEYLKALGYKQKKNSLFGKVKDFFKVSNILKGTRSLDRSIMKGAAKYGAKGLGLGVKYGAKGALLGGKVAGKTAMFAGKQVGSGLLSASDDIIGGATGLATKVTGIDKLINYMKKEDTEDDAAIEEREREEELDEEKAAKAKAKLEKAEAKKEQKENNKERFLSNFKDNAKEKAGKVNDKTKVFFGNVKDKAKSLLTPTTILLGIGAAMNALGVSMDDVKGAIGVVTKVLGSIWDTLKWGFDKLVNGFNYLKTIPEAISLSIGKMLPKAFGGLSDEEVAIREAQLAARRDGTFSEKYTESGKKRMNAEEIKAYEEENGPGSYRAKYLASETNTEEGASAKEIALAAAGTAVAGSVVKKATFGVVDTNKMIKNGVKGTVNAGTNLTKKGIDLAKNKTKPPVKKAGMVKKIKVFLGNIKKTIIKKVGAKAGSKLLAKIASRFIPFAGAALLAYDAVKAIKYMTVDGMDFKGAVSKAILGFNLFDDEEAPVDEDGNPIKPDTPVVEEAKVESQIKSQATKKEEQAKVKINESTGVVGGNAANNIITAKPNNLNEPNSKKKTDKKDNVEVFETMPVGGPLKKGSGWKPISGFNAENITSVAAYFESGKAGAGTVSSGRGDRGGVSYGTHQLASKTGTLDKYIRGSKYKAEFAGLKGGTPAFSAKWKEIYARDPEGFAEDQEAFITRTHYVPQVKKLKSTGLDLDSRSDALKSAAYSVGVQFGPNSSLIKNAMNNTGINPQTTDDEGIIRSIYGYKKSKNDKLFKSSSASVRKGTLNRAYKEENLVLSLLGKTGNTPAPMSDMGSDGNTEIGEDSGTTPSLGGSKASVDSLMMAKYGKKKSINTPKESGGTSNSNIDYSKSDKKKVPTSVNADGLAIASNKEGVNATQEGNEYLKSTSNNMSASVSLQTQMVAILTDVSRALNKNALASNTTAPDTEKEDMDKTNTSKGTGTNLTSLPKPAMDLKRNTYKTA